MVGCNLLAQVSEALVDAKGIDDAFGGMSVILAGDFAQLPPVSEKRLYGWVQTGSNRSGSDRGQRIVMGKLLWLSFNTVVILKQVMRQRGSENLQFVGLLSRLREGREDWSMAPTIVSDNATKDALNQYAAEQFARRTGRELHWYHARD
ncbi:hypothetical protein C8Q76DRAFT_602014, partial [Earliella scabrosa]